MLLQTLLALGLAGQALIPEVFGLSSDVQAMQARYEPQERAVTNWRSEAIDALEPKTTIVLATLFKVERPFVTRCVKLNNYWCIKSARWNGELATDDEGHVGFASADHGAAAAALLLKRYYLEFNRKSALDIVRRWAPPECGIATGIGDIAVLAVKGIGGTVRAQYLASHRKGNMVRYTAKNGPGGRPGRVSMIIPVVSKTPEYRVPDIAVGMGEKKPAKPPLISTSMRQKPVLQPKAAASAAPTMKPALAANPETAACAPDEQRLRNYAARMVDGLNLKPTDDLKLFTNDGTPLPNLTRVMLAMSSFELGALRASPDLVERAVQRAIVKTQGDTDFRQEIIALERDEILRVVQ